MRNWSFIRSEIFLVLAGKKDRVKTRRELSVPKTTWNRWLTMAISHGITAVGDHRHSNYRKLTATQRQAIRQAKKVGPWRSARHIRDKLALKVHQRTVRDTMVDLMHLRCGAIKTD